MLMPITLRYLGTAPALWFGTATLDAADDLPVNSFLVTFASTFNFNHFYVNHTQHLQSTVFEENLPLTFMFSCTKSLGTVAVVSNVELMPKLVSSPRVGGQIANSRAVSSPCNHDEGKYEIKVDRKMIHHPCKIC